MIYADLDIIPQEACGLAPMPVFHFGSDLKWLYMLLEKGYQYIGIGGLFPEKPKALIPFLDHFWADVLCDKDGMPKVKVHGFAVTAPVLVTRYPWWSVDSTSWCKNGIYGAIYVPRCDDEGKLIYNVPPHNIFVSNKSGAKDDIHSDHIDHLAPVDRDCIISYLKDNGVAIGKSAFKEVKPGYVLQKGERWWDLKTKIRVEVIEEQGVSNHIELRNRMNLLFFINLQKSLPGWPWAFKRTREGTDAATISTAPTSERTRIYFAGSSAGGVNPDGKAGEEDKDICDFVENHGIEMNRLVSFYYPDQVGKYMKIKQERDGIK